MNYDHALRDGLLATMQHSSEPMVLSDPNLPDNPVVAANAAFRALTGYGEAEIVGRNCRFLQGPGTDAATVEQMSACLREGQGCIQWLVNVRKNGSQFWNLLFISPVFGRDGQLLYFFANQHDLSGDAVLDLAEFRLGVAHMPAGQQSEFQSLLEDMGRGMQDGGAGQAHGRALTLEATLAAARQAAHLSMRLMEGPRPPSVP